MAKPSDPLPGFYNWLTAGLSLTCLCHFGLLCFTGLPHPLFKLYTKKSDIVLDKVANEKESWCITVVACHSVWQ